MSRRRSFPYAERAARVRTAQAADDVGMFWAAMGSALPPDFGDAYEQIKAGDPTGAERMIEFLEADPYFFRSGYLKADAAQYLKRVPLTPKQRARLRQVILARVADPDRREFRRYCHLAAAVADPDFRDRLAALAQSPAPGVRRRAGWVLDALG